MKKIILSMFLVLCFINMQAHHLEHFTVWYGIGYTNLKHTITSSQYFRAANFGIDYTGRIYKNWNWTVGAGYNQKGENIYQKMNYAQVEGNISYTLLNKSAFKVSALVGMYWSFSKDKVYPLYFRSTRGGQGFPYDFEYNGKLHGWQIGAKVNYTRFSLKVGFEHSLSSFQVENIPRINQLFARIGYSF